MTTSYSLAGKPGRGTKYIQYRVTYIKKNKTKINPTLNYIICACKITVFDSFLLALWLLEVFGRTKKQKERKMWTDRQTECKYGQSERNGQRNGTDRQTGHPDQQHQFRAMSESNVGYCGVRLNSFMNLRVGA